MPRNAQTIIDHADELAARFEEAEPNPVDDETHAALTKLRTAVVDRGRAEAALQEAVQDVITAGASWTLIGTILGTSRQAAQKRFGAARSTS